MHHAVTWCQPVHQPHDRTVTIRTVPECRSARGWIPGEAVERGDPVGSAGSPPPAPARRRSVGHALRPDPEDHAHLPLGLPEGLALVLHGERVDPLVAALVRYLDDMAADRDLPVGVLLVVDRERDAGVAADVAGLGPALGGVDDHVVTVDVNPHGRHLRGAIGHESREVGEVLALEEPAGVLGQRAGHSRHPSGRCYSRLPCDGQDPPAPAILPLRARLSGSSPWRSSPRFRARLINRCWRLARVPRGPSVRSPAPSAWTRCGGTSSWPPASWRSCSPWVGSSSYCASRGAGTSRFGRSSCSPLSTTRSSCCSRCCSRETSTATRSRGGS